MGFKNEIGFFTIRASSTIRQFQTPFLCQWATPYTMDQMYTLFLKNSHLHIPNVPQAIALHYFGYKIQTVQQCALSKFDFDRDYCVSVF